MRSLRNALVWTCLLSLGSGSCGSDGEPTLLVRNVRIVDPANGIDIAAGFVSCRGDRILAVGTSDETPRHSSRIIDGKGATLIPGLIDAHVHLHRIRNDTDLLEAWPRGGITSVIDLGGTPGPIPALPRLPRVFRAGPIVTAVAGYPDTGGEPTVSRFVESAEEATEVVEELTRDDGVDLIKIAIERGFLADVDDEGWPILDEATVAALVDAAHAAGKPVAAHVTQAGELRRAIEAGVDVIAHTPIDPIPDEVIRQMVQEDVVIVSTLSVWESSEFLAVAGENLRRYLKAGGRIAMGTDAPAFQSPGHPAGEVGLLLDAGVTPTELLTAMTDGGRAVVAIETIGTLKRDARCDLVLVDGDPLRDPGLLAAPSMIILMGTAPD